MSNKTTFKRVALAVIASLGFGVLASAPSNSAVMPGATMTVTAVSSTAKAFAETASATVNLSWVSVGGPDTVTVTAVQTAGVAGGPGGTVGFRGPVASDSTGATALSGSGAVFTATGPATGTVAATGRFEVITPTVAGTFTYTFYANYSPVAVGTFTFTVAAANTKPAAAQSSAFIQSGTVASITGVSADSSISVAATSNVNTVVASIVSQQRNSDSAVSGSGFTAETVTVVSSGVGLINTSASMSGAAGVLSVPANGTIYVLGDGRAGTQTITLTTTSMTTWKSFTVTYTGAATSATITAPKTVMSKLAPASTNTLRVTPRDAGNNVVTTARTWFIHSSDTRVVANSTSLTGCSVAAFTLTTGYGTCDISALIGDSGTTMVKLGTFAAGATPTATDFATNEVALTVVGSPARVSIAFDKRTYIPGEAAKITVSVADGLGRAVADQAIVNLFATGGITVAGGATNTAAAAAETVTTTSGSFTYTVNMPQFAGEIVASATGGTGLVAAGRVAVADTVTVTNPAEDAANSALDAAQEATDAAIAATDAAILAQEAADEAASAAIAAQETAQAAVDAVTALSAEVTKLVAQLATLQKLLNRVAKRVGVRR